MFLHNAIPEHSMRQEKIITGGKSMDKKHEKDHLDIIIGSNIRKAREERRLTRDELAELLGISSSHMGLIERGERGATAVTLSKISRVYEIPVDDLFAKPNHKIAKVAEGQNLDAHANRMKIKSIISSLPARDLEVVTNLITSLIKLP